MTHQEKFSWSCQAAVLTKERGLKELGENLKSSKSSYSIAMGLFLDLAAVLASESSVTAYLNQMSGQFQAGTFAILEDRTLVLFEEATGDFTRMADLSKALNCAVVGLHVHDEDLWLYELYVDGVLRDKFNTMPDYWGDLSEAEMESQKGNAGILAACWPGLSPKAVEKYLVHLDLDELDDDLKAYPDDKYPFGDCWQIVDFLKKFGTPYPPSEDE